MRLRVFTIVVIGFATLVAGAAPAGAGGWWSSVRVRGHELGVGETVVATSEAYFTSVEDAARARRSEYYAYLVSDYDRSLMAAGMRRANPRRWWAVPDSASVHRVGRVRLRGFDANVGEAVARVTIPRLPTGRYFLMFCDAGCRRPMGHAVPTQPVWITADPVAARAARRADAAAQRMQTELVALRGELRSARRDAAAAIAEATRDAELALTLAGDEEPTPALMPAAVLAAAFLAGVGAAALLGAVLLWRARGVHRGAARQDQERWRGPPEPEAQADDTFELAGR